MTPEIAAAKRRLELQATELPNWARQLLDYIADLEAKQQSPAFSEPTAEVHITAAQAEQILSGLYGPMPNSEEFVAGVEKLRALMGRSEQSPKVPS